jgi:hypothetical protein
VQNFGLATSPLVVALFMPANGCTPKQACVDSWNKTELFFVGMGLLGTCAGILLNVVDCRSKYRVLNLSDAAVKALREADRIAEEAASGGKAAVSISTGDSVNAPLLSESDGSLAY